LNQVRRTTLQLVPQHSLLIIPMTPPAKRTISMTYTKVNQKQQPKDLTYWQTRHPTECLATLEQIRQEYNQWKYNAQPRLQRVYRIIKQ